MEEKTKEVHCVRCGELLEDFVVPTLMNSIECGEWTMPVCVNRVCPAKGLLQTGEEKIIEWEEEIK